MPGIFDPTKAWSTKAHPYSLQVNGTDVIRRTGTLGQRVGVPLESIRVTEVGANGAGTLSFLYEDPVRAFALPARASVRFLDHTVTAAGTTVFGGLAQTRRIVPAFGQQGLAYTVDCVDYNRLLDVTVVPKLKYKAGYSDKALLQGVVAHSSRHAFLLTHTSFITQTKASMEAMDFSGMTLRAAIEAIQAAAGTSSQYYVDVNGYLHYYTGATEAAMGAAPYTFTDNPSLGTHLVPEDLEVEYDDSQLVNAVYVIGATPAGSGWVKDETAIKAYGLVQAAVKAPHSTTATTMANSGTHYLARHKDPVVRGSFSYTGPEKGFRVGQSVTITNAALGLAAAVYPLKQLDTTFSAGGTVRTYQFSFGELPASGTRRANMGGSAIMDSTGPSGLTAAQPAATTTGYAGGATDGTLL